MQLLKSFKEISNLTELKKIVNLIRTRVGGDIDGNQYYDGICIKSSFVSLHKLNVIYEFYF